MSLCAPAGPAPPAHCLIILAFILLPPGSLGTFRQALRHRDLDVLPAIHVENVAYRAEDSLKTWRIQNAIAPPHVESLSGGRCGAFKGVRAVIGGWAFSPEVCVGAPPEFPKRWCTSAARRTTRGEWGHGAVAHWELEGPQVGAKSR